MNRNKFHTSIFLWVSVVCLSVGFLYASPLVAKEVVVGIGDSNVFARIRGEVDGHKNTVQGGWVTLLRSRLDEDFPDEYDVLNKGINGDTARGVLNRLNRDVISLSPSIVFISIGDNDVAGFAGVANPTRNADDYRVIMEQMFNELQQGLPDTSVFIMGVAIPLKKYLLQGPLDWWAGGLTQENLDTQIDAYNQVHKDLAQEHQYFYVDIPSEWPRDVEESWKLSVDGVHTNDAGYEVVTEILYNALRSTVVHPIVSVDPKSKLSTTWGQIKDTR